MNTEEGQKTLAELTSALGSSSDNSSGEDILSSLLGGAKERESGDDFSFDPKLIGAMMQVLNSSADNKSTDLIRSIKPYLSEGRKEKADSALKLLRIMSILPKLQESGLLSSIF